MNQRVSATFSPEKKGKKKIIYHRIRRLIVIGLVSNLLLLVLYLLPFITQAIQKMKSRPFPEIRAPAEVARKEPLKKPLGELPAFKADHLPYLYAGHSYPEDSAGIPRNRDSHYAWLLSRLDLDPGSALRFGLKDEYYTVASGETVYSIAKRFGISVAQLRVINALESDKLLPRKNLKIIKVNKQAGYYGVDVSFRQNSINWKAVHADSFPVAFRFFIIKATQGKDLSDPYFERNWQEAKNTDIILGAYHLYVAGEDPVLQADNYGSLVHLDSTNFKPIVDLEYACSTCDSLPVSREQFVSGLKKFMGRMEARYGIKPVICTTAGFYNKYLKGDFDDHAYWMVSYRKEAPAGMNLFDVPEAVRHHVCMWQFSQGCKVGGIPGNAALSFLPAADLEKLKY
ncbi:MAG: glycoside hydrolase family 25 [Bacteroidetes bacterium]|nr:glycoside hydrolase family 25 [Bacteroidota bacterium]